MLCLPSMREKQARKMYARSILKAQHDLIKVIPQVEGFIYSIDDLRNWYGTMGKSKSKVFVDGLFDMMKPVQKYIDGNVNIQRLSFKKLGFNEFRRQSSAQSAVARDLLVDLYDMYVPMLRLSETLKKSDPEYENIMAEFEIFSKNIFEVVDMLVPLISEYYKLAFPLV